MLAEYRRRTRSRAPDRALLIPILFVGAWLAVAPPVVTAQDSGAPPGASPRWLPCEDWVTFHWLPYDETRLHAALGGRAAVLRWIRDDQHHTLAQLARRRGRDPMRLAEELVAPWQGRVSDARYQELRKRAERTLTQGHLAQHILFHRFHQPAIAIRARRLFGVSPLRYQLLRLSGRSPATIAAAHGRSRRWLAVRVLRVLRRTAARGVRQQATPAAQAARFLRGQRDGLSHWLDSRIRKPGFRRAARPRRRVRTRSELLCHLFRGNSDRPRRRP